MSYRHSVVPRVLCFVFYKDEVLLIKASSKKDWQGIYNPIGGHVEKGESVIQATLREIKEESGLKVADTRLKGIVHVENFFGKNVMMFVTSSKAADKKVKREHEEGILKWVKAIDLDKIKVFEDVKPILKHILKMNPGEIFVGTSKFDGRDKLLALNIKIN